MKEKIINKHGLFIYFLNDFIIYILIYVNVCNDIGCYMHGQMV